MPPEARLVAKIQKYLESRGARPFKIVGQEEGYQEAGIPDLLVCYLGRFVGIEVKQPGGKPSLRQLFILEQIEAAGGFAAVVESVSAVEELLDEVVPIEVAAWIGGFFDGEGCLHISMIRGRSGKKHYYPIVQIFQKDRKPLDWIAESLGMGKVAIRDDKVSHYLRIAKLREVRRFLRIVEPHVRLEHRKVKIQEAWELLESR